MTMLQLVVKVMLLLMLVIMVAEVAAVAAVPLVASAVVATVAIMLIFITTVMATILLGALHSMLLESHRPASIISQLKATQADPRWS